MDLEAEGDAEVGAGAEEEGGSATRGTTTMISATRASPSTSNLARWTTRRSST